MAKKRSHPVDAPKVRPPQELEPVEVHVSVPRTEFPERFKVSVHVAGSNNVAEHSYSRAQMESYYEQACEISKKSKLASCWEWERELKITYGAATWIMDIMEYRGRVKPIVYKDGVAESSGPRKFSGT
jgi:hypothetical protein